MTLVLLPTVLWMVSRHVSAVSQSVRGEGTSSPKAFCLARNRYTTLLRAKAVCRVSSMTYSPALVVDWFAGSLLETCVIVPCRGGMVTYEWPTTWFTAVHNIIHIDSLCIRIGGQFLHETVLKYMSRLGTGSCPVSTLTLWGIQGWLVDSRLRHRLSWALGLLYKGCSAFSREDAPLQSTRLTLPQVISWILMAVPCKFIYVLKINVFAVLGHPSIILIASFCICSWGRSRVTVLNQDSGSKINQWTDHRNVKHPEDRNANPKTLVCLHLGWVDGII